MIVDPRPQDQAVLSNVGELGEFKIKTSSRAFEILSSGLYANKIRAIIRELSCNAVDSHRAAGKQACPFDVHLPNQLEPWFSIRDYGVGLDHQQVVDIYTTYFESTKTNSNDFIGALGLGSKSPFSYTNNFTVTAIKNGRKGIYTAYINDQGVPSIALMLEQESQELNGLEVKFSVANRQDFSSFKYEAQRVYAWFDLQPAVTGSVYYQVDFPEYKTRDIIPGVHVVAGNSTVTAGNSTVAVMGNIPYPVNIPESEKNLGSLEYLLNCRLVLEFEIGEIEFQASREGLSYVPRTIAAIKNKLAQLRDKIAQQFDAEIKEIDSPWEQAQYLYNKFYSDLWTPVVIDWIKANNFEWVSTQGRYFYRKRVELSFDDLASKYNINIVGFEVRNYRSNRKFSRIRDSYISSTAGYGHRWACGEPNVHFIVNDTNIGTVERVKRHWRQVKLEEDTSLFVLTPHDNAKSMDVDSFFSVLGSPPARLIHQASSLAKIIRKPRTVKSGSILRLQQRAGEFVWEPQAQVDLDSTEVRYYVPLAGFTFISKFGYFKVSRLIRDLTSSQLFQDQALLTPYGIRKCDMPKIAELTNWVNLEDHVAEQIREFDSARIDHMAKQFWIQGSGRYGSLTDDFVKLLPDTSPYKMMMLEYAGIAPSNRLDMYSVQSLFDQFAVDKQVDFQKMIKYHRDRVNALTKKYPLLKFVADRSSLANRAIAEYITMIDQHAS